MSTTQKKTETIKNRTKRNKLLANKNNLSEKQKEILCKQFPNTYKSFETQVEEIFKKNKIDILAATYHLEKEVVRELKKAISPSKITPNNDFYS